MMADEFDNVTPIREQALKPMSQEFFASFEHSGNVELELDRPYLIKGWIERNTVSVVYGPSNVGKTFLALDMAHAISAGKPWGGCRVKKAPVMYIAAEGGDGLKLRIKALENPDFWVCNRPVSFLNPDADATFVAEAINRLEANHGPFGLVIIDTVAKAMSGADENTSTDMGHFIRSIEKLKAKTGAHIMLIHHTGKDTDRGMRGHSSLRAAVDTEIELTTEDAGDVIEAKATKQRDMQNGKIFAYQLREVTLGTDSDGDAVTTCVVEPDVVGERPKRAVAKGKAEIALQALSTALEQHGVKKSGPDYPSCRVVSSDHWKKTCERHGLFEGLSPESIRSTFSRQKGVLNELALVRSFDTHWWLT